MVEEAVVALIIEDLELAGGLRSSCRALREGCS